MTIIYTYDADGIFSGAQEVDAMGPMPRGVLTSPPPTSAPEVALWTGAGWTVLPERVPVPAPRAPVPAQVARAQGKAALITAGLWAGVEAFVAAIIDPTERALAEVALHDTQQWQRSSPFLNAAKEGLGLTDEQLDALFVAASKIEL